MTSHAHHVGHAECKLQLVVSLRILHISRLKRHRRAWWKEEEESWDFTRLVARGMAWGQNTNHHRQSYREARSMHFKCECFHSFYSSHTIRYLVSSAVNWPSLLSISIGNNGDFGRRRFDVARSALPRGRQSQLPRPSRTIQIAQRATTS